MKEWFKGAKEDFEAAEILYNSQKNSLAGFHLQQAVEKALKALAIEEKGEKPFSHNLFELAPEEVLEQFGSTIEELVPAYTGFRYPDSEAKVENISELINSVEEILEWIEKQVEK